MKLLSIFIIAVLATFTSPRHKNEIRSCSPPGATCYGKTPCAACSSCNYCKHCNSGGTCGVCKVVKKQLPRSKPQTKSSKCKATTQRGTRCSRTANSSGYCWQHD